MFLVIFIIVFLAQMILTVNLALSTPAMKDYSFLEIFDMLFTHTLMGSVLNIFILAIILTFIGVVPTEEKLMQIVFIVPILQLTAIFLMFIVMTIDKNVKLDGNEYQHYEVIFCLSLGNLGIIGIIAAVALLVYSLIVKKLK